MLRKRSWKVKFTIMILCSLLILVGLILFTVKILVTNQAEKTAVEKVKSDLKTGYEILDRAYPGSWYRDGEKLYKGNTLLNDNYEIVDLVGRLTGDTVTIFCGNTRVTTNVMKNGKRAVGTIVSDEVVETVLRRGQDYYGEANVVGYLYQTAYTSLKDDKGKIIGIWYVGANKQFVDQMVQKTFKGIGIVSGIIFFIVAFISYFIMGKMSKPLILISEKMSIAEMGDLTIVNEINETQKSESNDEVNKISLSFNAMILGFRAMIKNIIQVSEEVASSSEELSEAGEQVGQSTAQVGGAMQDIASGAEEQFAQIDEAANLISNLVSKINEVDLKSKEMSETADTTMEKIELGSESVGISIEQINNLKRSTIESEKVMVKLGDKSEAIGGIIQLISNIATQTNLLALNAAIEAARAGESGRGFSVVADEIRVLAEDSVKATEKIVELIREIQGDVSKAVVKTNESIEIVDQSKKAIEVTGEAFNEIKSNTERLYQFIGEITKNTNEMNLFSERVQQTVEEISTVSEQFSSNTEEVAVSNEEQLAATDEIISAAKQLAVMAAELRRFVTKFKV